MINKYGNWLQTIEMCLLVELPQGGSNKNRAISSGNYLRKDMYTHSAGPKVSKQVTKQACWACCMRKYFTLKKKLDRIFFTTTKKSTEAKNVLNCTFWKIRRIPNQIYPQTPVEPKYGAFYLNNEGRLHSIFLLAQLS